MRVGWAQKNTSLYVGGLEGGAITTELLQREFARFGPLDKELTAIRPGGEGKLNREGKREDGKFVFVKKNLSTPPPPRVFVSSEA